MAMHRVLILAAALVGLSLAGPAGAAPRSGIPAEATPPATTAVTLIAVPPDILRQGLATTSGRSYVELRRRTWEPEAIDTRPGGSFAGQIGLSVTYVEAGTYAERGDGPTLIVRASAGGTAAPPQLAAPGTEVVLNPGDALIHPGNDGARSGRNPGTVPLVLLETGIFDTVSVGPGVGEPSPTGISDETLAGYGPNELNMATPIAQFRLARLALAAGASLPPADAFVPDLLYVEAGALQVEDVEPNAGGATPFPARVYAAGKQIPLDPTTGQLRVLRSVDPGSQSSILLALVLGNPATSTIPDDSAAATPIG